MTVLVPASEPEVSVAGATPSASRPAAGAIVPSVAPNAVGTEAKNGDGCTSPAELRRTLASICEVAPPVSIVVGDALTPSTRRGSLSTAPTVVSHPAEPGPALQPHQLFSAPALPGVVLFTPTALPRMRLRAAETTGEAELDCCGTGGCRRRRR